MKKQIAAAITAALILTSITACKESVFENRPGTQGSSAAGNSTADFSENPSSAENESSSDNRGEDSEPEKMSAVFGETEIPDIPSVSESSLQPLESMVFEVHKHGDYTISLIGENVRTSKDIFPGIILMKALRIEVEKNGVMLGDAGYIGQFSCGAQFPTLKLFEDKIGSYISFYNMDVPVIALKYYYPESDPTDVEKALMFATIQNEEVDNQFVGATTDPIGVEITSKVIDGKQIYLSSGLGGDGTPVNGEEKHNYRLFVFGSDEFKVVDGRTLVDEEAGIKYTFDFFGPTLFERYTAEKID